MVVVVVGNEACRRTPGREEGGRRRKNQCFSNSYQFSPWLAAIRSADSFFLVSPATENTQIRISWTPNHVLTSEISLVSLQCPQSGDAEAEIRKSSQKLCPRVCHQKLWPSSSSAVEEIANYASDSCAQSLSLFLASYTTLWVLWT